ncbi:hypothetical protein ACOSOMT5_P0524 [Acidiphilium sp. MT5]
MSVKGLNIRQFEMVFKIYSGSCIEKIRRGIFAKIGKLRLANRFDRCFCMRVLWRTMGRIVPGVLIKVLEVLLLAGVI